MSVPNRLLKIISTNLRLNWNRYFNTTVKPQNPSDEKGEMSQTNIDPELASYYANLEVPYGADFKTVDMAWKRMLKKYHPDLHSNDPEKQQIANELVKGLNHAHKKLKEHLISKQ